MKRISFLQKYYFWISFPFGIWAAFYGKIFGCVGGYFSNIFSIVVFLLSTGSFALIHFRLKKRYLESGYLIRRTSKIFTVISLSLLFFFGLVVPFVGETLGSNCSAIISMFRPNHYPLSLWDLEILFGTAFELIFLSMISTIIVLIQVFFGKKNF